MSFGSDSALKQDKRLDLNDQFRQCAYLNLRDDGDVTVGLLSCQNQNEKDPYLCKYGKKPSLLLLFLKFESLIAFLNSNRSVLQ